MANLSWAAVPRRHQFCLRDCWQRLAKALVLTKCRNRCGLPIRQLLLASKKAACCWICARCFQGRVRRWRLLSLASLRDVVASKCYWPGFTPLDTPRVLSKTYSRLFKRTVFRRLSTSARSLCRGACRSSIANLWKRLCPRRESVIYGWRLWAAIARKSERILRTLVCATQASATTPTTC